MYVNKFNDLHIQINFQNTNHLLHLEWFLSI
jgi:hypothetical protein